MAEIIINEVSANYSYNIGNNSFATVAMPITACWGPGYSDPASLVGGDVDDAAAKELELESTVWQQFPATQTGLESFVSTYRGPASNYRVVKDYSYQMAMTLLTAGYDVLVCRVCPGAKASVTIPVGDSELVLNAKYPGTFGNSLKVVLKRVTTSGKFRYWNLIVYVLDSAGTQTSVENLSFVFELGNSTDSLLHLSEVTSNFLEVASYRGCVDTAVLQDSEGKEVTSVSYTLSGGDDKMAEGTYAASELAQTRFDAAYPNDVGAVYDYVEAIKEFENEASDDEKLVAAYKEWTFNAAMDILNLLKDKLSYSPNRLMVAWDDQYILDYDEEFNSNLGTISPLHAKLLDVAYYGRCATAMISIPRCLARKYVYDENEQGGVPVGYAQKLARYCPINVDQDINTALFSTHGALFAPWGQYTYVGTAKQNPAPPAFLALMIQRAMILNQTLQYEWAMPTNRQHNLNIGKLDYTVPRAYLDMWQSEEGVGVNAITTIPDLGTTIWGNSTLYEVPAATYQALANLSTRYLVNAVEDVAYRCGISITFQYNNDQAYNKFYAGCTPILDTMKNVGAIESYLIKMSADLNSLDSVRANSVIGKIYLAVNGVINRIAIDLIALPPQTDLSQYNS